MEFVQFSSLEEALKEKLITMKTYERVKIAKNYIEKKYKIKKQDEDVKKKEWEIINERLEKANFTPDQTLKIKECILKQEAENLRKVRKKNSIYQFESLAIIGRGAFGEVRVCRVKDTGEIVAVKKMKKDEMHKKNQVLHVRAEQEVLAKAECPWIVELKYSFQDDNYLYLVMEFLPGGDLMTLLMAKDILPEEQAVLYVAEMVLAIEEVHKLKCIHRDIKPDNILIDQDGHIKLSDFGLSRKADSELYKDNPVELKNAYSHIPGISNIAAKYADIYNNRKRKRIFAYSTVGTPDYIAPEVFSQTGYGPEVDWWSLGVILFEMIVGYPPFFSDSPTETCKKIMNWKQYLKFPTESKISAESRDLIRKLVTDVDKRIGFTGADEIKSHPFFKGIDWDNIKSTKPLFIPEVQHDFDTKYFDKFDEEDSFYPKSEEVAKQISKDICFIDFDFERGAEKADSLLQFLNDPVFIESALKQAEIAKTASPVKFEKKRTLETDIKENSTKPIMKKQVSVIKDDEIDEDQQRKKLGVKSSSSMHMPIVSSQTPKETKTINLNKFLVNEPKAQNVNRSVVEIDTAQGGMQTCKAKTQNKFNVDLFSGEKPIVEPGSQTTTNQLYVSKNKGSLVLRKNKDETSHQSSSVKKNGTQDRFNFIKDQNNSKEKIIEDNSLHQDEMRNLIGSIKSNEDGVHRSNKIGSATLKPNKNDETSVGKATNISIKKKAHLQLDDDVITFNVNDNFKTPKVGIGKLSSKTSFTTSNTSNQLSKHLNPLQKFTTGVAAGNSNSMVNNTTFTGNSASEVHLKKQASGNALSSSIKSGTSTSKVSIKSNLKAPATTTSFKKDDLAQQNIKYFSKNMHSSSSLSSKAKYGPAQHFPVNQNDAMQAPQFHQIPSSISTPSNKSHINSNSLFTKPVVQKNNKDEGLQSDKVENNNYNINFNLNIISPKNMNTNGFIFAAFNNPTSQAQGSAAINPQYQAGIKQHPSTVKGSTKIDFLSTQKKNASLKKFINK